MFARLGRHPSVQQLAPVEADRVPSQLIKFFGKSIDGVGGKEYLLTELAPMGSLDQLLQRHKGAVPVASKLRAAQQIVEGMVVIHNEGLVHRDLAARNVLVRCSGLVSGAL